MIEIETCHLVTIIMLIDLDRSHQLRLNLVDKVLIKIDHMKLHIPRYFTVKLDNQKQKEGPSA